MVNKLTPASLTRPITTWIGILFGLTILSVAWLWANGVNPDTDFSPAIIIIAYTPSLAAIITALLPGVSLGWLLRPVLVWRVSWLWYALALLGPLALVLVATVVFIEIGNPAPSAWLAFPSPGDIGGMIGPLVAGALGEEIGWRGFAQRLLQKRYTVLTAALIVGFLWATWHIWPAFAPGSGMSQLDILETYIRLMGTAVVYAWILNRTGSLLLVMLAHVGHNIAIDLVPTAVLNTTAMPMVIACLYALAALIVLVVKPSQLLAKIK